MNREFLLQVKEYIEGAEVTLDAEFGAGDNLKGLISKNMMPSIYNEVLIELEK